METENLIPPMNYPSKRILILCDFDGTVSVKDTVNRLVQDHVTSSEWLIYLNRYLRGEIGSRLVYEGIAPLLRMSPEDLEHFVREHAELDAHFPAFLQWTRRNHIDVKIVSDGFDATIHTLFRHHGIKGLEVFANSLMFGENRQVVIQSPHANPSCGRCGTCKLEILRRFRSMYDRIILIGDGHSDYHAATEADGVLALQDLFVYCVTRDIPAIRIDGFREVPFLLTRRIHAVAFDMDGTLVDSLESIADAFNHMFDTLGYPRMTVQEVIEKTSISLKDFVNSFLKPEEVQKGIRIFRNYYDGIFLKKSHILPGVKETLDALDSKVVLGLISNKRGPYARKLAEHLGFAHKMARIIGAEDGFRAKPAPDMFLEFMRSVGSEQSDTIYVGDSPIDVEAGRNAGVDVFALVGPYFSAEELARHRPRRVLHRLTDLPTALEVLI